MGYAGGSKENPTYHHLGDHTETVEMDFDPGIITYEELLNVLWQNHSPQSRPWSRQYMSAIFYHNEEQKKKAMESLKQQQSVMNTRLYTEILPASRFYSAEEYHQKYYLRQRKEIVAALKGIFRFEDDFRDSTATARLNGYFGRYLSFADLEGELNSSDLSAEDRKRILDSLQASAR